MEASSDSFSSNEWELSKENVQPMKQGRKMANLAVALAPSSVDQTRIHKEKREFEAQIRTYEGQDPLDIWYRYIVWTGENFPKGGKDLGSLIERCISTFRDDERYKNDERYAKVWLRYTDICTEPMDIFNYMHSQQVCSGLALFYESWAQLLENIGDYHKADEVFNLGINRNAQPLDRLRKQHKAFELRLAERVSNGLQQVSLADDSEPQRTTLGGLKRQGKKGTVGTKRTGNATLSKKSGIGVAVPTSNSSSNGFKIFCDDGPGMQSSLPPSTGEWQMPPTEPVMKRENTQKPGKWTDAKVSQRHHQSVPISGIAQKPAFSVHVDDDITNHPPPTPQHVSQFDKVLSTRKPDKPSAVMDALRNKPENAEGQKCKVMYCKEKIYAGTEEFSFEELRAARIFAKIKEGTYAPPVIERQPDNVRYMYPKKEVYSLIDGEFQYEEILARRYFARLKKQGASRNTQNESQEVQSNKVPTNAQQLIGGREMPHGDEPCAMDIGSCRKSVVRTFGGTVPEGEDLHFTSASHSSEAVEPAARRGLAFSDQCRTPLPSLQNSNIPTSNPVVVSTGSVHAMPPNSMQSGYQKSAFQPVQARPLQDRSIANLENLGAPQGNRCLNTSSCDDTENVYRKPVNQAKTSLFTHAEATPFNNSVFTDVPNTGYPVATNKFLISSRTPDANRSGDFNSSNLTGPSPTVFTKQALMVVGDMFNGPLDSERDLTLGGQRPEMDQMDKDFEAAFSNDDCTTAAPFATGFGGMGGFGGAAGFVIYDETTADKASEEVENTENGQAEDKENMPPTGTRQEVNHRPLTGILQPSVGIPTCPLDNDDEETDVIENLENAAQLKNNQPFHAQDKTSEVSLADFTHDHSIASGSFATAARMASTPFCHGSGPMSLPSIPWSTIRPTNENAELNGLPAEEGEYVPAHTDVAQTGGSFMSTPSKVLSPILEGSHEDSKSTNSSHSSNGSSRRVSCSASASQHNGLELSKIQEETSMCHTDTAPQVTSGGSAVINPFAGDVVNSFLLKITPPLTTYEGFTVSTNEVPRIAANASVNLGDDDTYNVEKLIGSGAFAKVYLANKRGETDEDDFETDDESAVVLKVQKISIEWEFYVSRQLQRRMQERGCSRELMKMFMNPVAAYVYCNSSVLVDKYKPLGTILDMVNKYKVKKKTMEEGVLFYYTIALLRILETMHACDVIHGDIKPDNFLVLDSDVDTLDGASLKLIDFGRSIDMRLFPAGTTFTANCYTEDFQCIEMKEAKPWTTQIDTYGLLGTIHCLLFLDYMKVYKDDKGRWKITKSFRRHWNHIWEKLFDLLLNTPSCTEQPSLRDFREEFERLYHVDEENYARHRQRHEVFMF
ncbi:hypothetical protein ACROYT_G040000 [Oculina patagonica]